MSRQYDAIIIGAGIIGACVGFELAKKGYQTLNIDKLHAAGVGSTAASCAIVRAHYSTRDGVAMAYENFSIWQNWEKYLEVKDPQGLAQYKNTGSLLLKSQGHDWRKVLRHYQEVGVEFEEWTVDQIKDRMPIYDLHQYWPPSRPEDEDFWKKPTALLEGAIYCPGGGYMSDPQLSTHNVQVACQAKGGQFLFNAEVVDIRRQDGRVLGVTLKSGEQIDAPVVVNVAGPHSFIINRLAGVEEGMNIKTRALRHEVHHVPSPQGFDFERDGIHTSDGDNASYFRPEVGNHILVGSEDPECDPREWVQDPDNFNRSITDGQYKAQVYRLARRIPSLGIPRKQQGVVDLYDVSDDWLPIYDKSDLKGFYMAVGSSGNQYKTAPVVGMIMAELIDQCQKHGLDHDRNPLRFTLPRCGVIINLGLLSRLRQINPESSF
ncbi:MAG: FAD-binding oxidoreductase, partial [Deltaproteobacteria bacterium]|nr:FAD-binding oxidoreductase [Deltaproteobacteria bacterium]